VDSYEAIEHYVNGQWKREGDATVSIIDHSFLYGDGVFDTMCARYGYIFKLDAHLRRLQDSARAVAIDIPLSMDELRAAVVEAAARNRLADAYLRVVLSRGMTGEPLLDPRGAKSTLVIVVRPYLYLNSPERIERGLSAKVVNVRHVNGQAVDARIKSNNYLALVMAKLEASNAGCDVALILDEFGHVCEGSGYNVFAVRDGRAMRPAESALRGITAGTVEEICSELGVPCHEGTLTTYDLFTADEVFLTSTAGGVMAVTTVDGRPIAHGKRGPVLKQIAGIYDEWLRSGRHGTSVKAR
jgi:branched-chain amino acid aminotransferase